MMGSDAPSRRAWGLLTRAERNAAYDNNAAVAASAAHVASRNAASAAFRGAHPDGLDLPYGPGERCAFDLYPARDPAAPCLVFIHGGYWQRGSRELFAHFAEGPLEAGLSVALPGYSLAPGASLTQIAAEIGRALDWLAAEGARHGVAGPVVLSGWSAGAQLAALHLAHRSVVAGFAVSGVYELGPIRDTALDEALQLSDSEVAELSPLRLPAVNKPLAVAYGTRELPALVDDARRFHAHRAAAHAPGPLIPATGADHFTVLDGLRSPNGFLVRAVRGLLDDARP